MDIYQKIVRVFNSKPAVIISKPFVIIYRLLIVAFWVLVISGLIGLLIELIQNDVPLYNDIYEM